MAIADKLTSYPKLIFSLQKHKIFAVSLDNIPDIQCPDGLNIVRASFLYELDHLDFSAVENYYKKALIIALNNHAMAFIGIKDSKVVYISYYLTPGQGKFIYMLGKYESTTFGDYTVPAYRRQGIHFYMQSIMCQSLRQLGYRYNLSIQDAENTAAEMSVRKLGGYLIGEAKSLTLFSKFNMTLVGRQGNITIL